MKMNDVDINHFVEHSKTDTQPDKPISETVFLNSRGGGSTWEPIMTQ